MKTQTRPKVRNPLHGPSDALIDARATLYALQDAQRSLPSRMVAAAANSDTAAYTELQMEQMALPSKILAAKQGLHEAEFQWRKIQVEAAIQYRELALGQLTTLRNLSKEVHMAMEAERGDQDRLSLEQLEAIYKEFDYSPKAVRKAREAWQNADAMVDEHTRIMKAKEADIALMRFKGEL